VDPSLRSWRGLLLFLSAVFWFWYAWRTVALASVVLAPLLARGLDSSLARATPPESGAADRALSPKREVWLLAGWLLVCMSALSAMLPATAHEPSHDSAVDRQLDTLPPGSVVLNQYDVGGWLTWRHPELNQVIDGLITPYSPEYVDKYFHARNADPGWRQFVAEVHPRAALLLSTSRLTGALRAAGWTQTARTTDYVLLVPPGSRPSEAGDG